jgi:phosphoadenosine phosphosulfate reductase
MNISLTRLQSFYGDFKAPLLLHTIIRQEFPGSVALLTSFDADAALLLSMAAEVNPATLVIFLDDGRHSTYARTLTRHLGLNNVRRLSPVTPTEQAWKAELSEVLESLGLLAIITGRRRADLPRIELDENGVFRINPLAGWTKEAQNGEMTKRNLPLPAPAPAPHEPDPCDLAIGADTGIIAPPATNWNL